MKELFLDPMLWHFFFAYGTVLQNCLLCLIMQTASLAKKFRTLGFLLPKRLVTSLDIDSFTLYSEVELLKKRRICLNCNRYYCIRCSSLYQKKKKNLLHKMKGWTSLSEIEEKRFLMAWTELSFWRMGVIWKFLIV